MPPQHLSSRPPRSWLARSSPSRQDLRPASRPAISRAPARRPFLRLTRNRDSSTTSGQPATQATLAVLVTPQAAPPTVAATRSASCSCRWRRNWRLKARPPWSPCSAGSGPGSPIAVLRSSNADGQVSTVDDADLVAGQSVVIQALATQLNGGKPASYGTAANGASAVAPSPAPTPTASRRWTRRPAKRGNERRRRVELGRRDHRPPTSQSAGQRLTRDERRASSLVIVAESSRSAAELIVQCLENEGVTHVFGIPGEENIHWSTPSLASSIRYVLARHEQGASFMAETYGRLTGPGRSVLGHAGPGGDQPAARCGRRDDQLHAVDRAVGAGRDAPQLQGVAPGRGPGVDVRAGDKVVGAGRHAGGGSRDDPQGVQARPDRATRRGVSGRSRRRREGAGAG